MAKPKPQEPKIILEREYNVPLRKGFLKVQEYKRATKAVKTLKEFLARHMKVYDRDLRKIKLDIDLNNEIRFRGMKKPLAKIKVHAKKFDDGIVRVSLVDIPAHIKFARLREERLKKEKPKDITPKVEEKKEAGETKDKKKETGETNEEKKEDVKEKTPVEKPKQSEKPISKDKDVKVQRKTLSR
jgi:ribosomal protein L31E